MKQDAVQNTQTFRRKPVNLAGLHIVVRNESRPCASSRTAAASTAEFAWRIVATTVVGLLCLLLK